MEYEDGPAIERIPRGSTNRMKYIRRIDKGLSKRSKHERRAERRTRFRKEASDQRKAVYAKYGSICYLCSKRGSDSIDHVIPIIKGGGNEIANLRPAHIKCNEQKGSKIVILPVELERLGW